MLKNKINKNKLSRFAVHPVSMHNTNHLISGDNKGTASQIVERSFNEDQVGKVCQFHNKVKIILHKLRIINQLINL